MVKAFTKEQGEKERFERINGDLSRINTSIGKITGLMQPIFTLTMSFANISLIWLGGRMAGNGQEQIGQVIGFVTYISFILTAYPDGFHDFYYAAKSRGIGYTY